MKKNFFKKIRLLSVLTALVLFLCCAFVGCGSDEEAHGDGEGVTFTDALNRTVRVHKHPQRVAALIGSFADVWALAGGELCAAAKEAWSDFDLELDGAVNIGGAHSPSTESLFAANPDFVLASASTASNVNLRETLEAAKITVAYFDVDTFDDYLHVLDVCTDITGRKDLYEQNGLQVQSQIASVKAQYAAEEKAEEERTVLLLRVAASNIKAKGGSGTILGEMLADMGCINIADSETSLLENLSIEIIMQKNPSRIFAVAMGSDNAAAQEILENMMQENPAWATLDAVKKGRVYMMDKRLFNIKPNARWGEAYQKLYETLTQK